ncbi:hypothetical protein [Bacillus horti]|uniref:Uncharacterized protein n=1 Tax=Caldalkalibacillus horti TaxID=77523 RepID=A0ABT9W093_9BACI|nr:hypothetical protein [Bacillus horti]MDQ0166651.1 hypothetical protein [Bacillus horti]
MSKEYREYCYAHINEDGWAWMTECLHSPREIMDKQIIPFKVTKNLSQNWYQSRHYNFETSEWEERHIFPTQYSEEIPLEQRIQHLEDENAELLLKSAIQEMSISDVQNDNAELLFKSSKHDLTLERIQNENTEIMFKLAKLEVE